ncbi:unnamed protein product [Mytilus edulis]|uniref:Uncharacterized protein n=1 Tax=Mytilus edulis TaxID=6550 RepID=A0A8S3UT68_MYTED|nr:unnamed protein product [Mytilus edulis]
MDTFKIETHKRILSNITSAIHAIVSSTLGCAVLCTNDPICCSVSYEENTKTCLLENLCRPEKEDRTSFTTLSKITECEFEGYVYDTISHACLKLAMTTGSTWTSARTICQQDGGDLGSLTTQMKVDFVLYLIRNTDIGEDHVSFNVNEVSV